MSLLLVAGLGLALPGPADARKKLRGSAKGYSVVVPGATAAQGTATLKIPASAAGKLVSFEIRCKPRKGSFESLAGFAALGAGQTTLTAPNTPSIGLRKGDTCRVYRDMKKVAGMKLR